MDITGTIALAFTFSLQADNVRTWGDPVKLRGTNVRPVKLRGTDVRPVRLRGER
jgi:hypothetical protein